MEELPNDDEIDLESLQAQIDLSLAHTKNLVSTWMKPGFGNTAASSSRANQDKEVEELLRRPPRLGVGAPIPASTGALAVEGVKLKNKLMGKKRQRDADETGPQTTMGSEDEMESRGRAIKKKVKVDPFGGTHGKKKAQKVETKESLSSAKDVEIGSANPDKPAPSVSMQEAPATPELASPPATGQSPTSAKKKKKKKKHKGQNLDTLPLLPQSSTSKRRDTSVSPSPISEKLLLKGVSPEESSIGIPHQTPKTNSPSEKLSSSSPHKSTPLLNLEGPPLSDGEEHAPSKKKRKRRKKKKSASGIPEFDAGKEPEAGTSP